VSIEALPLIAGGRESSIVATPGLDWLELQPAVIASSASKHAIPLIGQDNRGMMSPICVGMNW
jgi:hypothetical protein